MFGIGLPEMILILALALIVVGPDKLPDLARSLAKGILELKNTAQTLKENIASETPVLKEIQPELEDAAKSIKSHIIDSLEQENKEEGKKEEKEFTGGIYDPLDDDDYDDEDEDEDEDLITDKTPNKQDQSNADSSVQEGTNNQAVAVADSDNAAKPDDDLTEDATGKEQIEEPAKKEFTVHSTVHQDLNKETKS